MLEMIERSSKARMLAFSLWQFFGRKLVCRRPSVDPDHPNNFHIEIDGFLTSRQAHDLQPEVVIRRNARQEVGLVHELLHLNLIPLGFPFFRVWADDDATWNLAGGIINNAQHVSMLPTFLSLGYSEHEFLGPTRPHSSRELRVLQEINSLKPLLLAPEDHARAVSDYLARESIKHEIIWISDMLAR
jgi:hypothetical protein